MSSAWMRHGRVCDVFCVVLCCGGGGGGGDDGGGGREKG